MNSFNGCIEPLKSRLKSLLQPFEVDPQAAQNVFLDLATAYSSLGRVYHTLEHIQHILETIEPMRLLASNFSTIQLAAWFHDVVYDPKAKDNEEKSAEYAVAALSQLNMAIATIERVKTLILTTKTHQAPLGDLDSQILLDADLAILGADELDYQSYARAIRQEYDWVPDEVYRVERKQVLQNFLQRDKIYLTNDLSHRLEAKARRNLHAEIDRLSSINFKHFDSL